MQAVPSYRPGEVLVRLKQSTPQLQSEASFAGTSLLERFDVAATRSDAAGPILHLALTQGQSVESAIASLSDDERVAYAVPNDVLTSFQRPNDLDARLYGLEKIDAPRAWDLQRGSQSGPKLAVIDSGMDYSHPDLAANMWTNPAEIPANGIDDDGNGVIDDVHGFNAVKRSGDPMDGGSHGTHVGGTVAAVGDNGLGVTGVAQNAQIIACKFIDNGLGDTADAIAALLYADKMGARVTNNSWGGSVYNQALYDTLKASPALHICAAGNDSSNNDIAPAYPASYDLPNLVAVAATDSSDQLAHFSNFGALSVDVAAPGDKIFSTMPLAKGEYGVKSGTSMASPHVAGTALLIATQYPHLSNAEIKDRLIFGSDRLAQLEGKLVSGGGRLNAASSLEDDRVAPGAVTSLEIAEGLSPTQIPLRWRATGDDGDQGRAAAYEVRFATRPIALDPGPNEIAFDAAQSLPVPAPLASGSSEQVSLPLVPAGQERTFYVAVRAVDNVGQRGPLQTVQAHVPAARVAFADDGENGTSQWTATGSWGLLEAPLRGKVWADSPAGEYQCDQHTSLTSQPFSLQGYEKPMLSFDCRHDLEINFDKVFLEASRDGKSWDTLDSYNLRIGWEKRSYDLSPYAGGTAQIRFRLKTDADVTKDGFYFDNLVITETT